MHAGLNIGRRRKREAQKQRQKKGAMTGGGKEDVVRRGR